LELLGCVVIKKFINEVAISKLKVNCYFDLVCCMLDEITNPMSNGLYEIISSVSVLCVACLKVSLKTGLVVMQCVNWLKH